MNTRLGNFLYWAGLAVAAISVFHAVDSVWAYDSGKSLLRTSGGFMLLEDLLISVGMSILLALFAWRAGAAARSFVNKSAELRNPAKHRKNPH